MNYRLLATTALVAAGLWSSTDTAFAQAKVAPISVTVGGFHEQTFGYVSNKNNVTYGAQGGLVSSAVTSRPNRFSQQSDSEIWFSGNTTLANGLTIGFRVRLEANTSGDQVDESYLFVDGGFGRVLVGSRNDAAYLMHAFGPTPGLPVSSPSRPTNPGNAGASLNESGVLSYAARPLSFSFLDTTAPKFNGSGVGGIQSSANDLQRISYFTPRIFGFQGGISYTPNTLEDSNGILDRRGSGTGTNRTNMWSGAVNYSNTIGGVSIDASAGISYAPKINGAPTGTAGKDAIKDYAFGAQIGYMGFAVGGSFRKVDVNKYDQSDGYAWYVGGSWTGGPASVGLGYLTSRVEGASTAGKDRFHGVMLSGIYALGPGVSVVGSATYFNMDDKDTTLTSNDNKGVAVLGGLRLTF
jgi:hypothetical protein